MLGPVRVVAKDTYTHFHRLMNEPVAAALCGGRKRNTIVAGITEFRIVAGPFEFVPWAGLKRRGAAFGFMTCIAPVRRHRLVKTRMQLCLRVAT